MRAMVLERQGTPLVSRDIPLPVPGREQVRIDIDACGVCRTDLHVVDGDLANPKLPLVPGHEIVGRVAEVGEGVNSLRVGQRVGVPWLGHACGSCRFCQDGAENICDTPGFTGYTLDGGYAEACVADARFTFPLPEEEDAAALAPLLCAGLIGYRALKMAGDARTLGVYGFGAAAHILAQVAHWRGQRVFAFTRAGDTTAQDFATRLGAVWAGGSDTSPPSLLDAAVIFAPVGALVPTALRAVRKGGTVVCAGIHMSQIPAFDYDILWGERSIRSVANLTRADGEEFLDLVPRAGVTCAVETLALTEANEALVRLRDGRVSGALVLVP